MSMLLRTPRLIAYLLLLVCALLGLSCAATPKTPEEQLIADTLKAAGVIASTVTSLDLSGHDLRDLAFLPSMPQLKKLDVSGNLLTDVEGLLYVAPSLTELILADNPLLDNLHSLREMPLRILDISDNPQLDDLSPLGTCPRLERLVIHDYAAYGDHIAPFFNSMPIMPVLKELEIDESAGITLDWAVRCTKLEVIRCEQDIWEENYGEAVDLTPLTYLTDLRVLDLAGRNVRSLKPIAGASGMEELSVTFAFETGDGDWSPLAGFPKMRRLYCAYLESADVSFLTGMTHLESLHLSPEGSLDLSLLPATAPLTELSLTLYMPRMDLYPEDFVAPPLTVDLSVLTRYPGLTKLHLENVAVDPGSYAALTQVRDLAIGGWMVPLSPLALPSGLERLTIKRPDQQTIETISENTQLKALELENSTATDYRPLGDLTQLEELKILVDFLAGQSAPTGTLTFEAGEKLMREIKSRSFGELGWLGELKSLRLLSLGDSKLLHNQSSLKALGELTALEELSLTDLSLPEALEGLKNLTRLKVLQLDNTPASSLDMLQSMPKLERLHISCNADTLSLDPLRMCPLLQSITLNVAPLDPVNGRSPTLDLTPLSDLPRLESLTVGGHVADLGPLQSLSRLRYLKVMAAPREVLSMAPLVANPGINRHDEVAVRIWEDYPELPGQLAALEARGVGVRTRSKEW